MIFEARALDMVQKHLRDRIDAAPHAKSRVEFDHRDSD
jgi:hypothetical protein